ncbi:30S ribosomal protein S9 [Patescibacteria group bacterium]|nr:30S ribosomal protein S9 [Patescibacteria group bacterium]
MATEKKKIDSKSKTTNSVHQSSASKSSKPKRQSKSQRKPAETKKGVGKVKEVKPVQTEIKKKTVKKLPYLFAVGRRKTAVARVRLYPKDNRGEIKINAKDYKEYFPYFEFQKNIEEPLKKVNQFGKCFISIKVEGGGKRGQADAVCHGLGRILLKFDESLRKTLRSSGFLTRDSRKKERKKPGLKRARRAPQWAKR